MSKKRKKKKQHIDPYEVLEGRVKVTSYELIRLIHRINPTKENLGAKKESERYKIKARLQSLLIRKFCDGLLVEQPDPGNAQMVSLKLQYFDEDACHALLPELDPDARSWVQRQIDEAVSQGALKQVNLPQPVCTGNLLAARLPLGMFMKMILARAKRNIPKIN